ncbi:MAG: exodeoxyribonuclease VII large subunit [Lachnospiraceae bacterium]|nr:exodeoxyribonuclease VII large subunit [Lachnospiraceae bacterium]
MANTYTVAQVNSYIKNMFAQDFFLQRVYVKGEVSNCKYHTSGHIYFTLKDESGTLSCVMFAGKRKGLKFRLAEGQKVIAGGSIEIFERDGKYQMYASEITLDGAGELYLKFEALKRELAEMGMFADEYKQPISEYNKTIGIVTASTGAAVRDIIQIAQRRNPFVNLILYPAQVQGVGAKESIVKGIQMLDEYGVDVIIVGRGGGSIEDLWAFNEECVARAIFECSTPVISAVGHETDITIADYVADLRAPTPSAAAELAVFEVRDFLKKIEVYQERLRDGLNAQITYKKQQYENYQVRLRLLSPENKVKEKQMMLLNLERRMEDAMKLSIEHYRHRLQLYIEKLHGLSPAGKLNQGYAFVAKEGKTVKSIADVEKQDMITISVMDGTIHAKVEETEKINRK